MTDETDPAVTSEELQELFGRAPLEASARGFRVLPATLREPDVFFMAPEVSLDDALDVAVAVAAAFVSIGEEFFDAAEFLEDFDEVPPRMRNAAGSHDGDRTGIDVRWIAGGTSYAYWAKAAWWRDLTAELEEWREDTDGERARAGDASMARAQQLIREAIDDAGIRGAKPMSRKPVVEAFIRNRMESADDIGASYALQWAPGRVAEEWRSVYALLEQTSGPFIADLRDDPEWQRAKWNASARRDVLRRFAMSRTGGWAPTDTWVKEMDAKTAPSK
ncbi:hypothetical protein [Curtobacterium sp. MCPF17_031]|uniref:hypothetical protein n=1 Tax=Curtobacterium sp. MCPF17_031 TaxID=2175653 RepID=UPI000DA9C5AB|nr:hypothetical protein [Curtobacterium sp. MCPF17_031]PZE33338.1 hypothetical protein DEJ31_16465 [Curtobacterium sp. MCPF17_031]